ncbi:MAG TPA: MFS transporter [Candidatus Acidoferrum sp.]|jgi:ACS family hexuronate transporter-like MFS transporter|nr:MFS transporter [Candidatus Acidoferrum sp.]
MARFMLRWQMAFLVSAAIAISYLDRQTLPWAITAIQADIPFSNQIKAGLDSAFLATYGLMYLGGGLLLDRLGTRRGFLVIMVFWSLACGSHGFAGSVLMLAASRLLLGVGEGGGFPAATRAVAEWFPVNNRATAMGIINAGTAAGALAAPPLIALVLANVHWLKLAPWRWVFFLTGALGLLWTIWWWRGYRTPAESSQLANRGDGSELKVSLASLLQHRATWAVVGAKFLSDGAWYFYLFWLPKYLFDAFQLDIKTAGSIGWIPYAASGAGCIVGGGFSSWLLKRGLSVNWSRKLALGASAALMPWVMLVPRLHSVGWVIFIFSLAFFGQQSWSTLVMILPTDLISKRAVGTLAGLVGFGGAMGGVLLGQVVGWLRDHGFSYTPALVISGSMHVAAFALICLVVPNIQPLSTPTTR